MSPLRQLRLAILTLVALVVLGTSGYSVIERWSFLDSLYMTIITLATIGYKEVHPLSREGVIFTIILIVFGVTIVFWAVASLIESVVSEEARHALRRRRMDKLISKLSDHVIICGFGRMGQQIAKDLRRAGMQFVVIELNPEQIPKLVEWEMPFIEGNASDDEILLAAGIKRAKALVTVAPKDEDNVFVTLTARGLNKDLFIVARSIQEMNEDKLRRAGANRVMSPYVLGGRRMSSAVLKPHVLDFLDTVSHTEGMELEMTNIQVTAQTPYVEIRICESGIREKTGATIIAVRNGEGRMNVNPPSDTVIHEGDVLIIMGTENQLDAARKMASSGR